MSIAKGKVQNLVAKQGGKLYIDYDARNHLVIEVILPEDLVWDNGFNRGVCTITQDSSQHDPSFWRHVWREINYPVVKTQINK